MYWLTGSTRRTQWDPEKTHFWGENDGQRYFFRGHVGTRIWSRLDTSEISINESSRDISKKLLLSDLKAKSDFQLFSLHNFASDLSKSD